MPRPRQHQTLYHAAPPDTRDSILRHGLQPGSGASFGPPAVYLFTHWELAADYIDEPSDVWRVDSRKLLVHPDPEDPAGAVYHEGPIHPSRLRLVGTYLSGRRV